MQKQKTPAEIEAMREGGKVLATIYRDLRPRVKAGVTENELEAWVDKEIIRHGASATYKTPEVNFPASICISTNDQIVHSVPSNYVLKDGDVVSFDLVITYKGMKTDSAFTMIVGKGDSAKKHLLAATERSLYAAIDAIKGPVRIGDIGAAVEEVLNKAKLGIIRELVGHGVGHSMHEPPEVPNYGKKGRGELLRPGDTIAIEPMATLGKEKIALDRGDGWTISTADGSLAAHFEHTVMVTEDGVEILTQL